MLVPETPSTQFPKEERHDIEETFANSSGQCFFDGQTLQLELCSTRLDEAKPPPAKTNRQATCRRANCVDAAGCGQAAQRLQSKRIQASRNSERSSPRRPPSLRPGNRPTTTSNGKWRAGWAALTRSLPSDQAAQRAVALNLIGTSEQRRGQVGPLILACR